MPYRRLNRDQLFDTVYDLWRKERASFDITPLRGRFYGEIRELIDDLSIKIENEEDSLLKKILENRLKRLNFVITDLIQIREKKILRYVIEDKEINCNIAQEEYTFYTNAKRIHNLFMKSIHDPSSIAFTDNLELDTAEIRKKHSDKKEVTYVNIRFIKKLNETFQGLDGALYGPFNSEDVVVIPKENAVGLVKRGIAEKISINDKNEK